MRIIITLILLFTVSFCVQAQKVEGEVTSSGDSLPIEGTHIVNTTANKMAISDEKGRFHLVAKKGDTLVVSNVNFNTKQFIVNNQTFLKISLNPAVIQLDEIRVSNLPETESEFRKKILDMEEIEDNSIKIDGLMPTKPKGKVPKNYDPNYTNSLGYAINKPISFIVKKLSKSHKNKLKYYQTVANHGNTISNNKKYNPQIVEELTGLKGDDLTDFIHYLDLDPAFVKRASEYEIAARILKEFDTYKSQKG
ncbi:carboxypeptidase-like regulatory domain-containing protein [Marivirga sp.]|uniref:carboxypeptidase-like regulatory domain-containing protein n=1 Tax=Marivirga sp. TaxID=2018662 RepID=UPI0025E8986D|nr:carboxypeptidase-like regulatory domain-containing protein [Marivirga sp.]